MLRRRIIKEMWKNQIRSQMFRAQRWQKKLAKLMSNQLKRSKSLIKTQDLRSQKWKHSKCLVSSSPLSIRPRSTGIALMMTDSRRQATRHLLTRQVIQVRLKSSRVKMTMTTQMTKMTLLVPQSQSKKQQLESQAQLWALTQVIKWVILIKAQTSASFTLRKRCKLSRVRMLLLPPRIAV